jgi:hypothetical protein
MSANTVKWPRRAEFVNIILGMAVAYGDLRLKNVEFDGIAGDRFDEAIKKARSDRWQCNEYIIVALKLGAPVEGLVAAGIFGEEWAEVVALCKEQSPNTAMAESFELLLQTGGKGAGDDPCLD